MRIVSIYEKEIFPLMKWEKILDLTEVSLFIPIPFPVNLGVCIIPHGTISIGIHLLGTWV